MNQIFRPYWEWECYHAGMYSPTTDLNIEEGKEAYKKFFLHKNRFQLATNKLFKKWPNSCEHFLSNKNMNRVAWLGQAAICIECGISRTYKSGFFLLSKTEQERANDIAKKNIERWLDENKNKKVSRQLDFPWIREWDTRRCST